MDPALESAYSWTVSLVPSFLYLAAAATATAATASTECYPLQAERDSFEREAERQRKLREVKEEQLRRLQARLGKKNSSRSSESKEKRKSLAEKILDSEAVAAYEQHERRVRL